MSAQLLSASAIVLRFHNLIDKFFLYKHKTQHRKKKKLFVCEFSSSHLLMNLFALISDFMLNLRTSIVSLELDWRNENLVLRRDKKATSYLHRFRNFFRKCHYLVLRTRCCGALAEFFG